MKNSIKKLLVLKKLSVNKICKINLWQFFLKFFKKFQNKWYSLSFIHFISKTKICNKFRQMISEIFKPSLLITFDGIFSTLFHAISFPSPRFIVFLIFPPFYFYDSLKNTNFDYAAFFQRLLSFVCALRWHCVSRDFLSNGTLHDVMQVFITKQQSEKKHHNFVSLLFVGACG